jgi:hypothetical protein
VAAAAAVVKAAAAINLITTNPNTHQQAVLRRATTFLFSDARCWILDARKGASVFNI